MGRGSKFHKALNQRRWQAARRAVLERDGWRCVLCGSFAGFANRLEVDHIQPLQFGGPPYDPQNLQTLCRECHKAKTIKERGGEVRGRDDWQSFVKTLWDGV